MEEDKLEKEMAIKRAEETVAEFKAKFEAVEKMVTEEAEKKMEEAFRNREQKEIEARLKAEHEIHRRMEAERRAYEEAQAAAKLREEMQLKAEAEEQARREAEEHALAAAKKQLEEEEYRNQIQEWATEMAKKDREKQSQIHFKDALGRKFAIPFAQGQTWQGMKELIEAAFVHIDVLGGEVLAGHYDLVGPDGTIILPQTWDQIIQPGWNITMHMWPVNPPPPGPSSEPIIVPPRPPILPDEIESVHSNVSPHLRPGADGEAQVQGEENGRPARSEADDDADDDDDESVEVWPLSRRERIANAFSALKTKVFRRRRRDLGDDSSSYYYESDD
ncbi:hypothetical protein F4777DRAFT_588989 [Nemania sp. FL0916]|nr:hypothetical protein F4777DRAFT_588989 [Nemania sp. FL0916]